MHGNFAFSFDDSDVWAPHQKDTDSPQDLQSTGISPPLQEAHSEDPEQPQPEHGRSDKTPLQGDCSCPK